MFWKEDQRIFSWNLKKICTVAVHWWYIKDAFAGFRQQIFGKKKDILVAGCFYLNSKFFLKSLSPLQRRKSFM